MKTNPNQEISIETEKGEPNLTGQIMPVSYRWRYARGAEYRQLKAGEKPFEKSEGAFKDMIQAINKYLKEKGDKIKAVKLGKSEFVDLETAKRVFRKLGIEGVDFLDKEKPH